MSQYELSIDPAAVATAERLVALEGRGFPTLVVSWEQEVLGQAWTTILVLDYTIPLPPLEPGQIFNEVRIGAYTGEVATKFLYFGTELHADAPRVAPEMENLITPAKGYQEYRLTDESSALPYLELITSTPRIYGNAAQDYYSPPIKVERFDADTDVSLVADNFPEIVAGLPPIAGEVLADPRRGFWQGSRFVGTKQIAILHQGEVVGLRRRAGRVDKEVVPPEVVRRDPRLDVQDAWVAIDLGMMSWVVAIGRAGQRELIRLGALAPAAVARDFENPAEVYFRDLQSTLRVWSDRVILPLTRWGEVLVGFAARQQRLVGGREGALGTMATAAELGALPGRLGAGWSVSISGRSAPELAVCLEPPAPPIIDEEGISPDDPFDPLELYAYYLGLHVNTRQRGLHLRYALGMPTGWPRERRIAALAQVRRGLMRSLPAGMVAFDDLKALQVVDAGPNVLSFAAHAFKVFGITPRDSDPVPFVSLDLGASEASVLCGHYRQGTADEVAGGLERVIEHVEPSVLPQYGGEQLLHGMAYQVYAASGTSMKLGDIVFMLPAGEAVLAGAEERLDDSAEAQLNVRLLKDAVRPILEHAGPAPLPEVVHLFARDGSVREVRILVDRAALTGWLHGQLDGLAAAICQAITDGFEQVTKAEPPYADMRVLLGGRVSMQPFLQERLRALLPNTVRLHKFREADRTNLAAPTVKIACALGILGLRYQPLAPTEVSDERSSFAYVVGRGKRGKLLRVLDGSTGYDVWRELGACTRPEVAVLYVNAASAAGDIAADDPSITRVVCKLGFDAVGYRVYLRAVHDTRVEVSVGPPGGRPDEDAPCWTVDLSAGSAQPKPQ